MAAVEKAAAATGFDDFFVDLMYVVDSVDEVLETAGRVRVNVARGTEVDRIVAAVEKAAAATGFDDFFVDLMYVVDSVDEVLETAGRVLDRLR
ncbi:hypothetical protein [Nocardia terpenica]|uniref:Uncharacterized protein n=1 Tax=Nocardia terpenica TaxID=455432 RepID=A0A164LV94_9NOCA|nr:hypothetical protein [Nocardia terpenica]KZM72777.1 hypothetical protein AWN90_28825 [Nocardia terpenica]